MLYRHSEVFRTLLRVSDLVLVSASLVLAYWLRFHTELPAPLGVPQFEAYVWLLVAVVPIWFQLYRSRGLYEAQRTSSLWSESVAVVAANAVGVLLLASLTFFAPHFSYSRAVLALFFALSSVPVIGLRWIARFPLRSARRRGYNQRYVLGIGAGDLMERFVQSLRARPEAGLRMLGVLSSAPGRAVAGRVPVIGGYGQLKSVLREHRVDQVVIALPRDEAPLLEKILADLDDEFVSVRIVPDLFDVLTVRSSVEEIDGLPIICLRDSPLVGWSAVKKRAFDIAVSAFACRHCLFLRWRWMTSGAPSPQEHVGPGRVFGMPVSRHGRARRSATGPVVDAKIGTTSTRSGSVDCPVVEYVASDMGLVGPRRTAGLHRAVSVKSRTCSAQGEQAQRLCDWRATPRF